MNSANQEYDKLIFPEFCPMVSMDDDRLSFISHTLRDLMMKAKVPANMLEFEAKLG
jgi:hypothetical protein